MMMLDSGEADIHLPILMRGDLAPYGAPCLCESVGAALEELGPDPRLVGLVSPANVVEALWSQISPSARAAFDMIDADGSGAIDSHELGELSAKLGGEPMTEQEQHEAMRVLDLDRNGTIEFDEFQAWWDCDSNEVKIGGLTAAGDISSVIEHKEGWERRFGPRMVTTVAPGTEMADVVAESTSVVSLCLSLMHLDATACSWCQCMCVLQWWMTKRRQLW